MADKVVSAYSGGLNTSAAIRWLDNKYRMGVIALTVDIHGVGNQPAIWQETVKTGAVKALALDAEKCLGYAKGLLELRPASCSIDFHPKQIEE